jgi:hypothetical protein
MADNGEVTAQFAVSIGDEIARCAPTQPGQGERAMQQRRRFKQTELESGVVAFAEQLRELARL